MVSNILDKAAIKRRSNMLADDEHAARSALHLAGLTSFPLGDRIKATLEDVRSLLDARESDSAAERVLASLLGTLRADGYIVTPPAGDMPFDASDDYAEDSPKCGTFMGFDAEVSRVHDTAPPSSDAFPPTLLLIGAFIKIEGGPNDGRFARIADRRRDDMAYPINLLGRAVEPVGAIPVPYDNLFVMGKDPDDATVETKPDEQERHRDEPARSASEWKPTAQQVKGYADAMSKTIDQTQRLVDAFKVATSTSSPELKMKRWGKTFVDWAEAQVSA